MTFYLRETGAPTEEFSFQGSEFSFADQEFSFTDQKFSFKAMEFSFIAEEFSFIGLEFSFTVEEFSFIPEEFSFRNRTLKVTVLPAGLFLQHRWADDHLFSGSFAHIVNGKRSGGCGGEGFHFDTG